MTKYSLWVVLMFAFAKANYTAAQSNDVKQEKEEQVEETDFPLGAVVIVKGITGDDNIKYFKEFDGDRTSYEAKFKLNGVNHSIEFSKEGRVQDLEIEAKSKDVDKILWQSISQSLSKIDKRWRVEKLQLQYLPDSQESPNLRRKAADKNFDRLELIVAFKTNKKIYRRELLFDKKGNKLKDREVKRNAYDFLLF